MVWRKWHEEYCQNIDPQLTKFAKADVRIFYVIRNTGCTTLDQLASKTDAELLKGKNFGRKTLHKLHDLFRQAGFMRVSGVWERATLKPFKARKTDSN